MGGSGPEALADLLAAALELQQFFYALPLLLLDGLEFAGYLPDVVDVVGEDVLGNGVVGFHDRCSRFGVFVLGSSILRAGRGLGYRGEAESGVGIALQQRW